MVSTQELQIKTKKKFEIIDITPIIKSHIEKNKIKQGILSISTQHTTSSIIINENEPNLLKDLENTLESLIPNKKYLHNTHDNNAQAHLKSLLLGNSQTIPIKDSRLLLGTWQSILFVELDGPRERKIILTIISD